MSRGGRRQFIESPEERAEREAISAEIGYELKPPRPEEVEALTDSLIADAIRCGEHAKEGESREDYAKRLFTMYREGKAFGTNSK